MKTLKSVQCVFLCMLVVSLLSCASSGGISKNARIAFETYSIDLNYNYYYFGSDNHPAAIMRLDNSYTLQHDLWQSFIPSRESLKSFVTGMDAEAFRLDVPMAGYDILDETGTDIGDWYSVLNVKPLVQTVGPKRVIVYTPASDRYEDLRHTNPFLRKVDD